MQLKDSAFRCHPQSPGPGLLPWRVCQRPRPKALLAHGDAACRARARQLFRDAKVELITAHSADEVYRLARQHRPRLIILDANLPDETGYLACAKIKLDSPGCKVVVLAEAGENARFARFAGAEPLGGPLDERLADLERLAAVAC